MHGALRTGRASSVDFRFQGIDHLQSATSPRSPTQVSMFEKLARRNKSITRDDFVGSNKEAAAGFSSVASPKYEKGAFVWRDRDEVKTGRWRTRKTLLYGGLLLTLVIVAWTQDILNTPASQIFRRRRLSSSKASLLSSRATCNPYARQGKFEVDYAEPSNNVWLPAPSSGSGKKRSIASGDCAAAPQYMAHLRNADFAGLEWMRNRTVLLIGDSIERDHVSLFCSLLGREPEVVKGHHKLAPGGGAGSKDILQSPRQAEIKKKDRGARIAFKGMQESTLPRTCYIEELNFMIANLYHFGLDEQEYWAGLDQYHGPGPIEARFEQQVAPFLNKLSQAGRSVDLVEIGSGHYDLARWAREDVENKASTEEPLSAERLSWYKQRVSAFVALAEKYFPQSTRTYRPPTPPEEQSAELDYFNDRFGHSPSTVTPYFAPLRVYQLDAEIRSLLQPLEPSARLAPVDSSRALRKIKRDAPPAGSDSISSAEELVSRTFYNTWAQLVKGAPAHQLDRLHGGDLAAPGAVLWSDMMLWHLRQGTQDDL